MSGRALPVTYSTANVEKKAFGDQTRGVRRGGIESGILKIAIEGGGSIKS